MAPTPGAQNTGPLSADLVSRPLEPLALATKTDAATSKRPVRALSPMPLSKARPFLHRFLQQLQIGGRRAWEVVAFLVSTSGCISPLQISILSAEESMLRLWTERAMLVVKAILQQTFEKQQSCSTKSTPPIHAEEGKVATIVETNNRRMEERTPTVNPQPTELTNRQQPTPIGHAAQGSASNLSLARVKRRPNLNLKRNHSHRHAKSKLLHEIKTCSHYEQKHAMTRPMMPVGKRSSGEGNLGKRKSGLGFTAVKRQGTAAKTNLRATRRLSVTSHGRCVGSQPQSLGPQPRGQKIRT